MLTYFSGFGQTFFISASIAHWQATFDLSHGEFGRFYMFATLASALCLPFLGRIVDYMQPHRVILLAVPVLAIATLVAGFAASLTALIGSIFVIRLFGQGMMTHIALTTTGRWFVAERGRAISLVVLGLQGGEASLLLAFAAATIALGHSTAWALASAFLLLFLPLAYWCYREPRVPHGQTSTEASKSAVSRSWTRREVLRDPVFWVLLMGVLAPPFVGTTIFYHQNYLTALNDWAPQTFAISMMVMAATTICCTLLTGATVDRFGASMVLPFFLLPLGAACFVLAASGPVITLFAAMVLLGVSSGISSTLFGSLWPEIYGLDHLGAIRSVTVSAVVLATAAGPGLTGTLIDAGIDLPEQLGVLGIYCLGAAAVVTLASLSLRRRVDKPAAELP